MLHGNIIKKVRTEKEKVKEKANERKWWKTRQGGRKASREVLQISGNIRSYIHP